MDFKAYKIKKGCHRSGIYLNFYLDKKRIKYKVKFTESCLYKFGDVDDYDVNKLFGLSYGYHHKNSIRFGWNCEEGDKISIFSYSYKMGQRIISKIVSIPIDTIFTLEIKTKEAYYELKIYDEIGNLIGWSNVARPKTVNYGYELFPYFGGNKVAPHDIEIFMKRIV